MALPASGPLSMNDIRVELGVSSQSPMSLQAASIGTYATINTCSPSRPNSSAPYAISEWYSYCHTCPCFSDITSDPKSTATDACCSIFFNPDPTVGNRTTFCNSTTLTNTSFGAFSTGDYYVSYGGQYVLVGITNGNNTAAVLSSCSTCPTCPTATPTPTPTQTPVPSCPDRRVVIQICNTNALIDDNFDIYLNGTYIGAVNLNQDAQVGSIFIGDTNTSVTVTEPDFSCPLVNMVTYRFANNTVIRGGNNVLFMDNTQNNNNGNLGTVEIRNYLLDGNDLVQPCGIANLQFNGTSGSDFTFNFQYDECCDFLITPTPTKTSPQTPTPTPTPTNTPPPSGFIYQVELLECDGFSCNSVGYDVIENDAYIDVNLNYYYLDAFFNSSYIIRPYAEGGTPNLLTSLTSPQSTCSNFC